jgi:hypothetical protein
MTPMTLDMAHPESKIPSQHAGESAGQSLGGRDAFSLKNCESQLFVPMIVLPEKPCTDEKGQQTTFGAWREQHFDKP